MLTYYAMTDAELTIYVRMSALFTCNTPRQFLNMRRIDVCKQWLSCWWCLLHTDRCFYDVQDFVTWTDTTEICPNRIETWYEKSCISFRHFYLISCSLICSLNRTNERSVNLIPLSSHLLLQRLCSEAAL